MEAPSTHEEMQRLESEIVDLYGHITAATHRFLELVAEFDQAEGWGRQGFASCAHWLNLKCGIGTVAAREKVRVARALRELPKISAAFRDGRLSYSKVRAITRVATPEMQDTLLNIGLHGTASHMERLVREYRKAERLREAYEAEDAHRERYVRFRYDEDGSVLIHARLPPEVGALVKQAIEAAVEQIGQDRKPASSAKAASLSREDVSAETSSDVDTSEEAVLADRFGARRADALKLLAEAFLTSERERCPTSAERYQVVVHIDQRMLSRRDVMGGRCEIEDGPALAVDTARRLGCDSTLVGLVEDVHGNPLDLGRRTRAISPALKRALQARDGGCRFPSCDHRRFTHAHHVVHWADGGETTLSNLITLCSFHHRLVHEGGFGLRVTDDGLFVFTTPDGERLAAHGDSTRCFRGNMLAALNARRGIEVRRAPGWLGERMEYWWAVDTLQRQKRNVGAGAWP